MNKPVVMIDVIEPNVDAMGKVDLQVESTPGVYTVDIVYIISVLLFLHIYISYPLTNFSIGFD